MLRLIILTAGVFAVGSPGALAQTEPDSTGQACAPPAGPDRPCGRQTINSAAQIAHVVDGRPIRSGDSSALSALDPSRILKIEVRCPAELPEVERERLGLSESVVGVVYICTESVCSESPRR